VRTTLHLLAVAKRPSITPQMIPFRAGGYGTMNGSCVIVDYPQPDTTPGVYLEYPAGGAWVDNPDDVTRFTTMFDEVTRLALTPADTTTLIQNRASERDASADGAHAPHGGVAQYDHPGHRDMPYCLGSGL
jgi:hypothetical protein